MSLRTTLRDLRSTLAIARKSVSLIARNWRPLVRFYRNRQLLTALAALMRACENCGPDGYCDFHKSLRDKFIEASMADDPTVPFAALRAIVKANAVALHGESTETDTDTDTDTDDDLPDRGIQ